MGLRGKMQVIMQHVPSLTKLLFGLALAAGVALTTWYFRDALPFTGGVPAVAKEDPPQPASEKQTILEISVQARKNLRLTSQPARPQTYWRSLQIPGKLADRPGVSDRGVTSPAESVVTEIHISPGDAIRPGQRLFTLRLFSEYLQAAQTQLFKAKQETAIIQADIDRLSDAVTSGAVVRSKMIELQGNLRRQQILIEAARQDLRSRGLDSAQIEQIESGSFLSTIDVRAPEALPTVPLTETNADRVARTIQPVQQARFDSSSSRAPEFAFEVQELLVELGQQVQAGQPLATLANHQALYVVGHAFKREAPFLEQAAQEGRAIDIEFADDATDQWPELQQRFEIRHLSNAIDTNSRTFDFFIPLRNQSRAYQKAEQTFLVWRFRPGQRVRLHVPVEKLENVLVLPAAAVVRDGPEAYVFMQNGDLFKRLPVHVLHEDRQSIVLANDGSVTPGTYLAQNAAASLNRVLRSQAASGQQVGVHVHPDGTVHAAH
ncbi:efflux RND transporter periplasmic adaptor subunit [Rosistilla oblonga]|uniref:HlyD family secretion protein n=1 Tax=Rosistilla oblonga TaxID=2527990 RepID=A0A518IUS4_9BACT|nr:efflux RND transporter periplasmic adaptor subunit [Rosistilla oblonga]QDV56837.1 HlyD family secretion protein [Rosistilla oblonga]